MKVSRAGRVVVRRLATGMDLYRGISQLAEESGIFSGRVTGTGSVERAGMITYDQKTMKHSYVVLPSPMEIVSLYGEVDARSIPHVHIVLADRNGNGQGGQLTDGTTPVIDCEIRIEEHEETRLPLNLTG